MVRFRCIYHMCVCVCVSSVFLQLQRPYLIPEKMTTYCSNDQLCVAQSISVYSHLCSCYSSLSVALARSTARIYAHALPHV